MWIVKLIQGVKQLRLSDYFPDIKERFIKNNNLEKSSQKNYKVNILRSNCHLIFQKIKFRIINSIFSAHRENHFQKNMSKADLQFRSDFVELGSEILLRIGKKSGKSK